MDRNPQEPTFSKLEQMVEYRLHLMHLLPYSQPDQTTQLNTEIAFVDSFIAETCRAKSLILVIQDEPVMAITLVSVLRSNGYEACAVIDPSDAVALCADLRPDLAIVDVMLGKVNGIDLAVGLRQNVPGTKLLLLSAYSEANDCAAAFELRPGGMSLKTISPDDLLGCVENLLARPNAPQQATNHPPTAA